MRSFLVICARYLIEGEAGRQESYSGSRPQRRVSRVPEPNAVDLKQQLKWQRVRKFMLKDMQGTVETAGFSRNSSEPSLEIRHSLLRRNCDLLLDQWR